MRSVFRTFGLMLMLAALAVPTLAQDAAAEPVQQTGLGLAMLLIGLLAIVVVGAMMARREAQGEEEDLV